jgi:dTDP-4-amino-4,6-dideoxy-D-galactose acyltransferase
MGFLLFSIKDNCATIELISLSSKAQGKGAGTKLISALNNFAHKKGVTAIKVGTQVDNIQAVNFYLKKGFTYNQRNAVYHYWPRKDFSYE